MPAHSHYSSNVIFQYLVGRHESASARDGVPALQAMLTHDWKLLSRLGFNFVYLTGLFDHQGPILVHEEEGKSLDDSANRVPSMFAVKDHRAVHPNFGSEADLKGLLYSLQQASLQTLADFIPNQTGTTHLWVDAHPDYYLHEDGEPVKGFSGDVYMLNLEHHDVYVHHLETLRYIAGLGFDGVRCDMAHLVSSDFWGRLIAAVREDFEDFVFVAEAYSDSPFDLQPQANLLSSGFDLVYDQYTYRNIQRFSTSGGSLEDLVGHVNYFQSAPIGGSSVHYLANHDDGLGQASRNMQPLMLLLFLMDGMVMVTDGTLAGRRDRIAHHVREVLPEDESIFGTCPVWFSNICMVVQALSPRLETLTQIDHDILYGSVTINEKPGGVLLNLSVHPARLPDGVTMLGEGLLHGMAPGEELPARLGELFFVAETEPVA